MSERGARAIPVAAAAIETVEAEWSAYLGPRRITQLRQALLRLREATDPYA